MRFPASIYEGQFFIYFLLPPYSSLQIKTLLAFLQVLSTTSISFISSGKTLPSMTEFFAICDYFGITPIEFFDTQRTNPNLSREVSTLIEQLNEADLTLILANVKRLLQK